jgi:hypothetical protein
MNILAIIIKLLPAILQAIIAVEAIISTSGSGATKKEIVMSSVAAAAKAGETSDVKTVSAISALVDNLVSALNVGKVGTFAVTPKAA